MRLPLTIGLVLLSVSVLGGACSKPATDSSKQLQPSPGQQTPAATPTVAANNSSPLPMPTSPYSDAVDQEALREAQRLIAEHFQRCSNDLTYTVSDSRILEIEMNGPWLEPAPGRSPYIDTKNGIKWIGNLVLAADSVRSFDVRGNCWSKYDASLDGARFPFSSEDGQWKCPGLDRYKLPTCQDVQPYLDRKGRCS